MMHIVCPAHLILHDVVTLIVFGEQHRLRSSSLSSYLYYYYYYYYYYHHYHRILVACGI
jgi:hypothetical protein